VIALLSFVAVIFQLHIWPCPKSRKGRGKKRRRYSSTNNSLNLARFTCPNHRRKRGGKREKKRKQFFLSVFQFAHPRTKNGLYFKEARGGKKEGRGKKKKGGKGKLQV